MDNKAYLDQIAVKGKNARNTEPLLSPLMIKLVIAAVIMLITIIIVGVMLNSTNTQLTQSYERLYLRVSLMHGSKGPYEKYGKYIRSAELRGYASQLDTSLTNTDTSLTPLLKTLQVDKSKISKDVSSKENSSFSSYMSLLEDASISGQTDATYSAQTADRIMNIILLEQQIRSKSTEKSLAPILDQSITDLQTLYEKFRDFNDSL